MKVFYYSKIYEKHYFCLIILFIVKIINNKKFLKTFINKVYQQKNTKKYIFTKYFVLFCLFLNLFIMFNYHTATAHFYTQPSLIYLQNRYISSSNFFSDKHFFTSIQRKTNLALKLLF